MMGIADKVASVGDRFLGQSSHMVITRRVVDPVADSAGCHHASEAKLHQVLGHRSRLSLDVNRQLVHGMLAINKGRNYPQPGRIGQQLEHVGRSRELVSRGVSNYLLIHADSMTCVCTEVGSPTRVPTQRTQSTRSSPGDGKRCSVPFSVTSPATGGLPYDHTS